MKRVANNKAYELINNLEEFQGSNMFGKWLKQGNGRDYDHELYVVYSYGSHFPMYVYDDKERKWIGNSDKYSRSTTRHQSQARPCDIDIWYNTEQLKDVIWHGGLVESVMERARA